MRPHIKKDDTSMLDLIEAFSKQNTKYSDVYRYLKELMEGKYPSKLNLNDSIIFLSLINNLKYFIEHQDLSNEKNYLLNKFNELTEQVKSSKENQRQTESENSEFLEYFKKIDPAKLKVDIQKATAELNADKFVNYDPDKEFDEFSNLNDLIKQSNSTANQTSKQTNSQTVLTTSSSSSPSSINSNLTESTSRASNALKKEENPFHYYIQMPRVRQIKESLNPLDISIDIIRDLHSHVTLDRLVNEENN